MSPPHPSPAPGQILFPPSEWQSLRRQDKSAGRAVAGIMMVIFALAIIGYTYIMIWVATE